MLRELLSSRLIQGGIVFVVVMVVGSLSYLWHVEREIARDLARSAELARRYEERRQRAQQETAARKPTSDAVGGHWHGDEWHASDLGGWAPNDGEAVEIEEPEAAPEAPPTLTRSELGGRAEALPYPMTPSNRHVWDALVTEAAEDPVLMQKLLPDTKEKAHETMTALMNSWAPLEIQSPFKKAMWRKMAALYPNDAEVLILHATYSPGGPKATRAENEAFVAVWERIKRLNDEQGIPLTSGHRKTRNTVCPCPCYASIPLTSGHRKTHGLSRTYLNLGEYDKAIQNIQEQLEWIAAIRCAGLSHRTMHYGLLGRSGFARAYELKRQHEAKQSPQSPNPTDK